MSEVALLF